MFHEPESSYSHAQLLAVVKSQFRKQSPYTPVSLCWSTLCTEQISGFSCQLCLC